MSYPKLSKNFVKKFDKVNLVLQQADPETIAQMVIRGQADIGIATESLLNNAVLRCHRYYDWSHVVIVPKTHELAEFADVPDGVDLPTLASYPIVTYHGGFTGRGTIDKVFEKKQDFILTLFWQHLIQMSSALMYHQGLALVLLPRWHISLSIILIWLPFL